MCKISNQLVQILKNTKWGKRYFKRCSNTFCLHRCNANQAKVESQLSSPLTSSMTLNNLLNLCGTLFSNLPNGKNEKLFHRYRDN